MELRTLRKTANQGYQLIEILITIGIIGVIMLLQTGIVKNYSLGQVARNKDIALKVANHKIEELRGLGYTNLPVSGTFTNPLLNGLPSPTASITISDYKTQVKQADVTITWTDKGDHKLQLTTLIAKNGGL